MPTKKPPGLTSVTAWVPNDLLARLDGLLAEKCRNIIGARPSRQAWIVDAVRRSLDGGPPEFSSPTTNTKP